MMELGQLTVEPVVRALKLFLETAYADGKIPENRRHFVEFVASGTLESLVSLPGIERLPAKRPELWRGLALRVGCAWYPHLKMIVSPYGEPPGYVFAIDTHDTFKLPPNAPDQEAIAQLRSKNQELAQLIVRKWEEADLPTQGSLLRRYLERTQPSPATSAGGDDP